MTNIQHSLPFLAAQHPCTHFILIFQNKKLLPNVTNTCFVKNCTLLQDQNPFHLFHLNSSISRSVTISLQQYLTQSLNTVLSRSFKKNIYLCIMGFAGGSKGKESACSAGDPGSIPWLGRSPGEGNGNPLQYSCLGNSMDRGAWQAMVHGVAKSKTQLSD